MVKTDTNIAETTNTDNKKTKVSKTNTTSKRTTKKPAAVKTRKTSTEETQKRNAASGTKTNVSETSSKKKTPSRKTATTKAPAKKTPSRKTATTKTPAKKTPSRKTTTTKTPAKKTPSRKTTTTKAPAKKTPSRKTATTKTPAKKTPSRKTTATKTPALQEMDWNDENEEVKNNDGLLNEDMKEDKKQDIVEKTNNEVSLQSSETDSEDKHENITVFDGDDISKAVELVDSINVAFLHPSSTIVEYKEGSVLIVQDTLKNRYKLKLETSSNPVVNPKVSVFYVMRPAKFRKGDVFDSELIALFSNEDEAKVFLNTLVEIHDKKDHLSTDEKSPFNKRKDFITIHSKYLDNNSKVRSIVNWCVNNKSFAFSIIISVLFVVLILFMLLGHSSSQTKNVYSASNTGKSYVNLSPTEEKIRADNMVIAEINRIQNNEPPAGLVGKNIRSRGFDSDKIAILKDHVQKEVAKLIEIQGKINTGMGSQSGGHNIPFSSQTDRFGIPNVPPEDSWSTTSGARMSVPSGSNDVSSQKDLAEFGIINQ